ncbi:uncharacterized protein [Branchiostoma lanceolatum]|uniref:uncharacterized protein n=1 Tax=Branchiostoma lanceolatum TaxID=7740 RepID=UPI0011332ADC
MSSSSHITQPANGHIPNGGAPNGTSGPRGGGRKRLFAKKKLERLALRRERHKRMTKMEILKEKVADKLKLFLVFALPVVLMGFILLVLIGIYVVRPYNEGQQFVKSSCQTVTTHYLDEGSCSSHTDVFQPCLQVYVHHTAANTDIPVVLMENEQALMYCEQCSLTFGRHALFTDPFSPCVDGWKDDYNKQSCAEGYRIQYEKANTTYPCYYNPTNPEHVVKEITLTSGKVVNLVLWPLLLCLVYTAAVVYVVYERRIRKQRDQQVTADVQTQEEEEVQRRKSQSKRRKIPCRHSHISTASGFLVPSSSCSCLNHLTDTRLSPTNQLPDLAPSVSDIPEGLLMFSSIDYLDLDTAGLGHLDLAVSDHGGSYVYLSGLEQQLEGSVYTNAFARNTPPRPYSISSDSEAVHESDIDYYFSNFANGEHYQSGGSDQFSYDPFYAMTDEESRV